MNHELRDCFRDLYSSPILEDLLESFELRYPSCDFPPLPERGALDMEDVTKSTYFFN
jgi:DNA-directed RNA polymerase